MANPRSEVVRVRHFQVDHKLFAADFKRMLLADERKPDSQFDQEPADALTKSSPAPSNSRIVVSGVSEAATVPSTDVRTPAPQGSDVNFEVV